MTAPAIAEPIGKRRPKLCQCGRWRHCRTFPPAGTLAAGPQPKLTSLAETQSDLYRTDPKPVIGATYTVELNDRARQLVPMVARSDPAFAPAATPRANPQNTKVEDRTRG